MFRPPRLCIRTRARGRQRWRLVNWARVLLTSGGSDWFNRADAPREAIDGALSSIVIPRFRPVSSKRRYCFVVPHFEAWVARDTREKFDGRSATSGGALATDGLCLRRRAVRRPTRCVFYLKCAITYSWRPRSTGSRSRFGGLCRDFDQLRESPWIHLQRLDARNLPAHRIE